VNRIVLALGASAVLLSACGLRGDLERPVPLFGNPPDEGPLDPRNIKKAEDAAKAEKDRKAAEDAAARKAQQQQMQQQATPPPPTAPAPQ
jgi:Prokaryotic lipoprotein-attachment site